jgi:hypothetical protein
MYSAGHELSALRETGSSRRLATAYREEREEVCLNVYIVYIVLDIRGELTHTQRRLSNFAHPPDDLS